MDQYDSDSSGLEDAGDYTETGVLLGFPSKEPTDDTISHLGGWPTWLDEKTPPGNFANCKACGKPMLLLLQLHGDLPEYFPNDERRLYIFGCPRKACSRKAGSVRAIRAVRKLEIPPRLAQQDRGPGSKGQEERTPKEDLGARLFGTTSSTSSLTANLNPFSTSCSPTPSTNDLFPPISPPSNLAAKPQQNHSPSPFTVSNLSETFAEKARLSSLPLPSAPVVAGPALPWPAQSAFPHPYPEYHLDAEYETLSRPSTSSIPSDATIQNLEEEGNQSSSTTADSRDTFESTLDRSFLRFSTRLSHNPEQVLRYEFCGFPLLYSPADAVGRLFDQRHPQQKGSSSRVASGIIAASRIPRCESCGRERVFELQLVPHAISVLEEGREGIGLGKDDTGMEWGTIILAVCSRNCGPAQVGVPGWHEEWVGVQWEEVIR
ncbi:hypothetical protein Egran_04785 [Elaphomyces granulatus]|uniref:Programmed cell death protein 2 C-terminal domain-containing protein n=1 Tax=Elaphomyces granulatus TaxID=519963 RepID=A0A232LTE4_9EURO|nr:hypothetical protein Egran_04785 [Elaphomyces granulatus]